MPHLLYAVVGGNANLSNLKREIVETHRIGVIAASLQRGLGQYAKRKQAAFDDLGYGYIGNDKWRFDEIVAPKIQPGSRRTAHKILSHLNEDMRCGVAGSSGQKGGYMTPFKRTMNKANEIVDRGGEWHIVHITEINESMGGHHYATDAGAKAGIAKFLVDFGIARRLDEYRPVFVTLADPDCT